MIRLVQASPSLSTAVHIASLGFVQEESDKLAQDVNSHLQSGSLVYRIFDGKSEVGFAIFTVHDDILYLSGIIILPESQGQNIAGLVIKAAQGLTGTTYLALRTQSLRMFIAARRLCEESYPLLTGNSTIPDEFRSRGEVVAKAIGSQFPIHHGCYSGALYGVKPIHRDSDLQTKWDQICNFENGDAIIFVGRLLS